MAGEFIDFLAFWPATSGRGFRGQLDRRADPAEIVAKLKEGWTPLMFVEENATERQPSHRVKLAPPRENTQGTTQRRDAPESHVSARDSRAALDMQRPARGGGRPADYLSDEVPFTPCWEA